MTKEKLLTPGLCLDVDLRHPETGQILLSKGTVLTEGFIRKIERLGLRDGVEASLCSAPETPRWSETSRRPETPKPSATPKSPENPSQAASAGRPLSHGEPAVCYGLRIEGKMAISALMDEARALSPDRAVARRSARERTATWKQAETFIDHLVDRLKCLDLDQFRECRLYDAYTFSHPFNTAVLSLLIGEALGCGRQQLRELGMAALVADIGLTWISRDLLDKPARFGPQELPELRAHVRHSVEILKEFPGCRGWVAHVAATHHERHDGSGYPKGLQSLAIADGAQIVGLADAYDAMLSDRPYRKRLEPAVAFRVLTSGPSFAKGVVTAFARRVAPYPKGTRVLLNTGEEGEVVRVNPAHPLRPVVEINGTRIDLATSLDLRVTRHVVPRRFTRLPHRLPVHIQTAEGQQWHATTVDLSTEGLGLVAEGLPPGGQNLFLTVLVGGRPVNAVGQLVWAGASSGLKTHFAVTFMPGSHSDHHQLVDSLWNLA